MISSSTLITAEPEPVAGEVSAMVLAAGEGRRFDPTGAVYKLLQTLPDGRPIIRAVCETLLHAQADVMVVCGTRQADIEHALSGLPVQLAPCPNAAAGMGASIKCGVAASRPRAGWLVMLGDMPWVDPSTLLAVRRQLLRGALIARPYYKNRPGHPVAFSTAMATGLHALDDTQGPRELIRQHAGDLVKIQVNDPGCVYDIDTPADLLAGRQGV